MHIDYAIDRLTYLKDNNADPETREALNLAITLLKCTERQEKRKAVKRSLDQLDVQDPKFMEKVEEATKDLTYPEHEWIPSTVKSLLEPLILEEHMNDGERTTFSIRNEDLNRFVRVLEDDGMGYGSFNAYAFTSELYDNDFRLWI